MTRIVAGSVGGRTVKVPPKGTRPTSERVREALFSRLEHLGCVDGVKVLDVYAGSGALGFEALSRGAKSAIFVEKARQAAQVIVLNARNLGFDVQSTVISMDAERYLAQREDATLFGGDIDLVFLDPPYDVHPGEMTRVLHYLGPWVTPDALILIETSTRAPQPQWPDYFDLEDMRTYGETSVWFIGPSPRMAHDNKDKDQ